MRSPCYSWFCMKSHGPTIFLTIYSMESQQQSMVRNHKPPSPSPIQETLPQTIGSFWNHPHTISTHRLKLPCTWKIHNIFHASLLSPYFSTEAYEPSFFELPPNVMNNKEKYEVKAILSHKGPKSRQKYLTSWKGYSAAENTWEPESNLCHSALILSAYKQCHNLW